MTTVAILQPSYLSWPGHFYWMKNCDVFIFLDDVQYTRQDWRNRNYVKTSQGKQLLTVPIHWYGNSYCPINRIRIANEHQWAKKHLQSLRVAYSRAPYFKQYFPYFEGIFSRYWEMLSELDITTMKDLAEFLDIRPRFIVSSELNIFTDNSTEKLVKLCQSVGASVYVAGKRGYENYIEHRFFEEAGIKIVVKDYAAREYPQLWGDFISHLSVVDLLFNCGPTAKDYLEDVQEKFVREENIQSNLEHATVSPASVSNERNEIFLWRNEYDSNFFKKEIFTFSLPTPERNDLSVMVAHFKDTARLPRGLIIGRIPISEKQLIQDALDSGFEIICRMIDLGLDLRKQLPLESSFEVRPAIPEDYEMIIDIAGKVFSITRFHREKNMSALANEYHKEWIGNCLGGGQADMVFVFGKPKPEGFIALAYDELSKEARIVLIGVAQDKQGRGIGKNLLKASMEWAKTMGADHLYVRTEEDNRAVGFYLKNGFKIKELSVYLRKDNTA